MAAPAAPAPAASGPPADVLLPLGVRPLKYTVHLEPDLTACTCA